MADLFCNDWMLRFMDEWNNESGLVGELARIKFNSTIAYGFKGEPQPRAVIVVSKGKIISVGEPNGKSLNWDLRAEPKDWQHWFENPPGMMALGMAYTSRKLIFNQGDYASMIKDPGMAGPFIKSFEVMSRA